MTRRTLSSTRPFAAPWLAAVVLPVACCARLLSAGTVRPADGVIGSADRAVDFPSAGGRARYRNDGGRYVFVPELSNPQAPNPDAVELHELRCADCREAAAREDVDDGDDDGDGGRRIVRTLRPKNDGGKSRRHDHRRHRVVVPNASGHNIMVVTTVRKTLRTKSTTTTSTTQTPLASHSPITTNRVFNVRWNNVIKKTTKTLPR